MQSLESRLDELLFIGRQLVTAPHVLSVSPISSIQRLGCRHPWCAQHHRTYILCFGQHGQQFLCSMLLYSFAQTTRCDVSFCRSQALCHCSLALVHGVRYTTLSRLGAFPSPCSMDLTSSYVLAVFSLQPKPSQAAGNYSAGKLSPRQLLCMYIGSNHVEKRSDQEQGNISYWGHRSVVQHFSQPFNAAEQERYHIKLAR